MSRLIRFACAAALLPALGWAAPAQAQQGESPLAGMLITGYGSVGYHAGLAGEFPNDFDASISPVLLFGMGDDILFEAELEFGLEGGTTTTTLEYAQIDYLGFENVQIIGGKFLLPFGLFGERIHPTWINKLPSMPLLYGHAHGGVAEGALLPILADAGAMVRFNQTLGNVWGLDLSVYVTQGPRMITEQDGEAGGEDDHAHDPTDGLLVMAGEAAASEAAGEIPSVGFGTSFSDNNKNKMFGARLGFVHAPGFEVYLSGFHGMYDEESYLDFTGLGVAVDWRRGPLELRGEGVLLRQEFQQAFEYVFLETPGYYVQASRRFGSLEPVVRWSQLLDGEVDGVVITPGTEEFSAGLVYWIGATVPVKAAWSWRPEAADRVSIQWAFGF